MLELHNSPYWRLYVDYVWPITRACDMKYYILGIVLGFVSKYIDEIANVFAFKFGEGIHVELKLPHFKKKF